jgi:hypothetical protein
MPVKLEIHIKRAADPHWLALSIPLQQALHRMGWNKNRLNDELGFEKNDRRIHGWIGFYAWPDEEILEHVIATFSKHPPLNDIVMALGQLKGRVPPDWKPAKAKAARDAKMSGLPNVRLSQMLTAAFRVHLKIIASYLEHPENERHMPRQRLEGQLGNLLIGTLRRGESFDPQKLMEALTGTERKTTLDLFDDKGDAKVSDEERLAQ